MKDRRFTIGLLSLCLAVPAAPPSLAQEPVKFTDVTAVAGIKFTHNSGKAGKKWLPETMGAGNAFFDADGDGLGPAIQFATLPQGLASPARTSSWAGRENPVWRQVHE